MDILIAVGIWFIAGGLADYVVLLALSGLAHHRYGMAMALSPCISFARMATIFYVIKNVTDFWYGESIFIYLTIADILWNFVMMKMLASRYGAQGWAAHNRTGRCIGSIVFAVAFFIFWR